MCVCVLLNSLLQIRIGDKLRALNGEELMDLTPYERE